MLVLIALFVFFLVSPVEAAVFRYTDEGGLVHFVDRREVVPEQYRNEVFGGGEARVTEEEDLPETTKLDTMAEILLHGLPDPGYERKKFLEIEIVGEKRFIIQINDALALLRDQAPLALAQVRKYVPRIQQGDRTMTWTKLKPVTVTIQKDTALHTLTFTAAIIAHESCHAKLSALGQESDPKNYESIKDEEMKCIDYEKGVLKDIGAPLAERKMADKQDGTHFDVNKDGKYDLEDFRQMKW